MKRLTAPLIGACAMLGLNLAGAEQRYEGVIVDNGRNVPISLTLDPSARLGADAGLIRFNGAWKCGFELEFAGPQGQASSYSLDGVGPGRCKSLTSGYLLSQVNATGIHIQLHDKANVQVHSFTLSNVAQ